MGSIHLKRKSMELVALFIKHGDRFTLRNFMIFYIVKIYLESLYDLRAIFGLQPVPNLLETGAKLGELHICLLYTSPSPRD